MSKEPKGQIYVGRFAPSPSGPLHFGSLVAALGSYLQARSHNGKWLVRMEDLDPPREMPGADTLILNSLEAHGMHWDGDVMYQSERHEAYESALEQLQQTGSIFYCSCSNKQLKELRQRVDPTTEPNSDNGSGILSSGVYPGICREQKSFKKNCAIRLQVNKNNFSFNDLVYGKYSQNLAKDVGDFILKRRDGLYAYQLAVVVDDIEQGITAVVRGVDLLDSTPRQLYLYDRLNAKPPSYLHLPLALLPDRKKLSKQTGAPALLDENAADNLMAALQFLGLNTPDNLAHEPVENILKWGVLHWSVSNIPTQDSVI